MEMKLTQEQVQPRKERGKLLWRFLKGSKALFLLCMCCAALSALAEMVVPQIIRVTVDNVIGDAPVKDLARPVQAVLTAIGGTDVLRQKLWLSAVFVMAVALVSAVARYGFRVFNARASETLVKTMRDTLFSHIERLPFQWHMSHHTGDIIQRCTSDIETSGIPSFFTGSSAAVSSAVTKAKEGFPPWHRKT